MMERPQTASDSSQGRSGIPVMSKGKHGGSGNIGPDSPGRSAIPRLQARNLQPNRSFASFKTEFDQKKNKQTTNLRSKSFDEKNERRGFEMMTHGEKNQLRKQVSSTNLEELHKPRAKSSGSDSKTTRGSSVPRSAMDVARQRASSMSKSAPNAANTPSEIFTPTQQLTTTASVKVEPKKKKVGRTQVIETSKRLPEMAFNAKKKKLEQLKNELQAKQKQVLEAYTSIIETKKLIEEKTGKKVEVEQLQLPNYVDEKKAAEIDTTMVQQMELKLVQIPDAYQVLCNELVENRSDIIHWLSMQHACKNHVVTKQLDVYRKEAEKIRQKVSECHEAQGVVIKELLEDWKKLWDWKETSISGQFEELEAENHRVKDMLCEFQTELERLRSLKADLEKKLQEAENNLSILKKKMEEKDRDMENMDNKTRTAEKQTINSYETKLKVTKQKQKEMEMKIKTLEQKIESLTSANKKMEEELKKKDSSFDNRTKELLKSSKVHEALVAKLEKERIGVDMRIKDLQQLVDSRELEYENNLKEYKSSIQTFETKIATMQNEIDNYEKKYSAVREELVKLQMKNHQDTELMKKRKFGTEPGGPGIHTQTEMDMWTELQATRVALKAAEEKLVRNNEERERFLQTIEKAVSEKDQLSSEGWTAKLVLKDEEIENLKHKIEQLSDTIVYSRDLATKQEKKISDLKKTLDSLVASDDTNVDRKENDPSSLEIKIKWEQEHKKNQELEEKLNETEAKIGQMHTKIKEQENLLKVRDGLIGIMKSKKDMTVTEYDQLREYVNDLLHQYNELNTKMQQKSAQVDDLYTSIECKTMQIERLEKTVKSMEDLCQEANKTNFELQERIKFYQKQVEDYQKSVAEIRPPCEEKGNNHLERCGEYFNKYSSNYNLPSNYHMCYKPMSCSRLAEKSLENIASQWYLDKNLSLLDSILMRQQFVAQVKKLIQQEFITHARKLKRTRSFLFKNSYHNRCIL